MTEQDRVDVERIFEKDPVGVFEAARRILGTTPEERRLLRRLEADMRCAVELDEEAAAAESPPRPRRKLHKNRQ